MVKLDQVLSKNDPDEKISQARNITLHQKDFWILGLNAELEATAMIKKKDRKIDHTTDKLFALKTKNKELSSLSVSMET